MTERTKITCLETGKVLFGTVLARGRFSMRIAVEGTTLPLTFTRKGETKPYVARVAGIELATMGAPA